MTLRRKQIRNLVNEILFKNKITSAPVSVEKIARNLGATIAYEPAEDELSGFILRDNKKDRIIIGINSTHPPNRKRFTLAHEIGHLLLHSENTLHIDEGTVGFSVRLRDEKSEKGTDIIEREANLFAAELLMPMDFIENDMSEFGKAVLLHEDKLLQLAEKYEVSNRALTYRLANLGYIQL